MAQNPFYDYTLIAADSFPYYVSMCAEDVLAEILTSPLGYASFMPRGIFSDSKDTLLLESLPDVLKAAKAWLDGHGLSNQGGRDPHVYQGVSKEELFMETLLRYMSYYMACIEDWGGLLGEYSIRSQDLAAYNAFVEAFQIILFVPELPDSAVQVDLAVLYKRAAGDLSVGDGWAYVAPE